MEEDVKLDYNACLLQAIHFHSKRPTIPFKLLPLVQPRPPQFPLLVLTSIGEDDDVRSLQVVQEDAELWVPEIQ